MICVPKEAVQVDCRFFPNGRPPKPLLVGLPNGRVYRVLEPLDIRRLDAPAYGHTGYQISVRIKTGRLDLFYDDRRCRWYVAKNRLPVG